MTTSRNNPCLFVLLTVLSAPLCAATDSAPANDSTRDTALILADQQKMEALINEIETRDGPFAEALGEIYLGLGNNLVEQAEYDKAMTVFDTALQHVRIRDGLHNPRQLPILEQLIDTSLQLQQWETTDTYVHLFWRVARQHYPPGAPERLLALQQLSLWQEQAAATGRLPGSIAALRDTAAVYEVEIRTLTDSSGATLANRQLARLKLDYAAVQFALADLTSNRPLSDFDGGSRPTTKQQVCQYVPLPNGGSRRVCDYVDVPNVDFYLGQTARRDMEIKGYLGNMQRAIKSSYELLQVYADAFTAEDIALLSRIQKLTGDYNDFSESFRD